MKQIIATMRFVLHMIAVTPVRITISVSSILVVLSAILKIFLYLLMFWTNLRKYDNDDESSNRSGREERLEHPRNLQPPSLLPRPPFRASSSTIKRFPSGVRRIKPRDESIHFSSQTDRVRPWTLPRPASP